VPHLCARALRDLHRRHVCNTNKVLLPVYRQYLTSWLSSLHELQCELIFEVNRMKEGRSPGLLMRGYHKSFQKIDSSNKKGIEHDPLLT
jgi:hypothetical protein